MILVIIRMKVLAEKRKELSQTIASLIGSLSPSSHKFGDEFIASGLSAEGAITGFEPENTSPYLRIEALRTEKGCRRCDFCQNIEDENELCILEEWDTRENLNSHLKSERFRVLRGAMSLLQEPYEMMAYTVLHPADMVGPMRSSERS
jgi:quinol monooxygenase YgiN